MIVRLLAILSTLCVATPAFAATDLLAAAGARLVEESSDGTERQHFAALTDGDHRRPAGLGEGGSEFVIAFDELVSPESLIVHLAGKAARGQAVTVEVLASMAAQDAGYRLLRSGTVGAGRERWRFDFLPSGARWLMLRITPGTTSAPPPVSEIEILGRVGAPSSRYAFQESPADAARVLVTLREALSLEIDDDERRLFDDAADGRLDDHSPAVAALMASGVSDASERARLLARIDALEVGARASLPDGAGPMARARRLLVWLHANAFTGGYEAGQTDLSELLDSGRYNCVSSAMLYALLGRRLGLDVRGIEVPDHAFAIVYDGSRHADVETTTVHGFDPARDRAALAAFTQRTGFAYIPGSNAAKRRETSLLGLIALTHYNHGVEANQAGRHEAALRANYRALRLDPGLDSAVKNTLAALGRWAAARAAAGEFEAALALLGNGLLLAPGDRTLLHNRRVVWQRRIDAVIESGSLDDVAAVARAAHAADPSAGFDRQEARGVTKRARALADEGRWAEALSVTGEAVGKVGPASAQALDKTRVNLVLGWMGEAIGAGRWEEALEAAAVGQRELPLDSRIRRNGAYLLQEWSEAVHVGQGAQAAVSVVRRVRARLDGNAEVQKAATAFVKRRVREMQGAAGLDEAVAAVGAYAELLDDEGEAQKLVTAVIDARAGELIKASRWPEAAQVYAAGRDSLPGGSANRSYQRNLAYIGQEWLGSAGEARQEVAVQLMDRFADVRAMPKVIASAYMREVERLHEADRFDEARAVAGRGAAVLGKDPEALRLLRFTYDRWAAHFARLAQWQASVDVYARALAETPDDRHLAKNARATWHQWAKSHMDRREWAEAISVYERALQRMPGTRGFEQNIRYCRQEMAKGR